MSVALGCPTRPRSTSSPAAVRWTPATSERPMPPSAPVSPTPSPPAAPIAATSAVFVVPASTATTASSVASSVTRSPSAKRGATPRRMSSASMARPPPWTTTSGSLEASWTIPTAAVCRAAALSSNSPPSLSTVIIGSVERRGFVESERHVEILNRLACRALHEVVDADRHHELTALAVDLPADVAEVRVRDVLDLGQVLAREPHERRAAVRLGERALDVGRADARLQPGVDRLEDAAVERHEVRHERHRHADFLFDLGRMPVREYPVGGDAAVAFGEMR